LVSAHLDVLKTSLNERHGRPWSVTPFRGVRETRGASPWPLFRL